MSFSGIAGGMTSILGNSLSVAASRAHQSRLVSAEEELHLKLKKANREIEELKSFIENELKSVMESIRDDH